MTTPLRRAREKKGETTRAVAAAVDMDQSFYVRVEGGKKRVSPGLAERLALHFGNSVSEMEILYPERYIEAGARKPVQSQQLQEA